MPASENPVIPATAGRGANAQRQPTAPSKTKGGRPKKTPDGQASTQERDRDAEIAELKERLAAAEATNKNHKERAARGGNTEPVEEIIRLERPKGEAGDRKNGFVLIEAMGLEDNTEEFSKIQSALHINVTRAHLDVEVDYRHQDPAKLAAVYKLMRKEFKYLTEKRFPLNWALAEMAKQYLRNKRKYGVRIGRIPSRAERKRKAEENTAQGRKKRRRGASGAVPHIDEEEEEDDDEENNASDGGGNAGAATSDD